MSTYTTKSLIALLRFHEHSAAAVRATIALLESGTHRTGWGGPRRSGPSHNGNGPMREALKLEAARRATLLHDATRVFRRKAKAGRKAKAKAKAPAKAKAAAPTLTRRGGWNGLYSKRILRQRQETDAALAKFKPGDVTIPAAIGIPSRLLGPLVRRGYLARKGDGYIRTAKPFHVKPPRSGDEAAKA